MFSHKQPRAAVGTGRPFVGVKVRCFVEPLVPLKGGFKCPACHRGLVVQKRYNEVIKTIWHDGIGVEKQQDVVVGTGGAVIHLLRPAFGGTGVAHDAVIHHHHHVGGGVGAASVHDDNLNVFHQVGLFKDAFDTLDNIGLLVQHRNDDGQTRHIVGRVHCIGVR